MRFLFFQFGLRVMIKPVLNCKRTHPPKHMLTSTKSNHSFLIDACLVLAMSGSAQSVFGSNQIEVSEEKPTWQDGGTQIESKARGPSKGRGTRH